ncbi:MAG TPA: MASE1 domain-containing protein [Vicinamibacterales bacterium]|jgi:diguanylate cyclase (GGDEF)-like protein/PAS domain S-box-containing protein
MKTPSRLIAVATVTVAYVAAARFGFAIALTADHVTFVWPPSGVALSALLLLGVDVWPGILLGALAASISAHDPLPVAAAVGIGNTLEAVIAAKLLRRVVRLDQSLDTLRQALGLVVLGAVASTIVGATIGVTSLCVAKLQPWSAFPRVWWSWWLANASGDLLIVPAFLTWHRWRDALQGRMGEAVVLLGGLTITCAGVFGGLFGTVAATRYYSLEYIVFPFVIWAAIRFGAAGAAAANVMTASIAVWSAVHGLGPNASGAVTDYLLLQQLFIAVVATTGLLLGAAISEHTAALGRRDAEHSVTRILADATTGQAAIGRIIDVINADLDWDVGLWWSVDPAARRLRCAEIRRKNGARLSAFGDSNEARVCGPGEDLPGHVWAYAAPQWISDVLNEPHLPRPHAAAIAGLRSAFAFPISVGKDVVGVLEFGSRRARRPDDDLLWMFTAIGAEVGQFLARKRMEQQIQESEARKAGLLNAAIDCIITVDQDGRIIEFNPAAERTFGYRSEEILGRQAMDLLVSAAERDRCLDQLQRYRTSNDDHLIGRRLELVCVRADGANFPAELSVIRISSADGPWFTAFVRDITRQKRRTNQLAFRATHDGLTKLLNRSAFMDRLKEALARGREVGGSIAILFIDLDHFKALNDNMGHLVGDRLLIETGRRLRRCVRPGDAVARLGGDEFAITLERIIDVNIVAVMADRIKRELDRPFVIGGDTVELSASVGTAINDHDGDRPDDLLRKADAAMYRAKAANASRSAAYRDVAQRHWS